MHSERGRPGQTSAGSRPSALSSSRIGRPEPGRAAAGRLRIVLYPVNPDHDSAAPVRQTNGELVNDRVFGNLHGFRDPLEPVQHRAGCGANAAREIALDRHRGGPQLGASREHAVDHYAGRPHVLLAGGPEPLLCRIQAREIGVFRHQPAEQRGGADVSEIARHHRAPERNAVQGFEHRMHGGRIARLGPPLAGKRHGHVLVQIDGGRSGRLVERQQHQPRRHFRAETEQAAVEGHHPAWKHAAGGGQRGHRGFLQKRVYAPPLVGHINAVVGAGLSRLTNGHAAHPLPGPVDSSRVEGQDHVAGADHQPGRQPLHPGGGKGQHFVEHRAGLAPGSFHGQRAEQLAGERVLRKAARIAAGVDHEHALSCPPVFETAGRIEAVHCCLRGRLFPVIVSGGPLPYNPRPPSRTGSRRLRCSIHHTAPA